MPDPLHKSKRTYALAAIISPYIIRLIAHKLELNIPEEIMLVIQSGLIEVLSHIIAVVLIMWSKAKEKIYYYVKTEECKE